ncbi:MAG: hypothetical protein P8Y98_13850 [Anaerolineales bacterium]
MVKVAIATCFEEGPKIFRHTNSSWYTLMDVSPWTAWIPSKRNTHAIADSEEDDIGIVALPHLSRDLLAVMDNAGDMFGTHPQNIIRGLIYEDDRLPDMYNLIDQYRVMKHYNKGFGYNLVYVGPGWMGKTGRWEASYRILKKSYEDFLAYYGKLKRENEVEDMTMTEFADWFHENQPRSGPYCGLWKDVLWGTRNQALWYVDSKFRVQVDLKQGGAITDLRPYASKLQRPVGVGTEANQDASYPFIIQSRYRAGAFTHYAGEGAINSCKVRYGTEEVDFSACRTTGGYREEQGRHILDIQPVEVEFHDLTIKLVDSYTFIENSGEILIKRTIVESTDPEAEVEIDEYVTSCWGTTEYPEDLSGSLLSVTGNDGKRAELRYEFRCRNRRMEDVKSVDAVIPQVQTRISLIPAKSGYHGYFEEGYSFAPNIKIGVSRAVSLNQGFETCLKVDKV